MHTVGGRIFEKASGSAPVADALVTFRPESGGAASEARSAANGTYRLELPAARYVAEVAHPAFRTASTAPGFAVVAAGGNPTFNFFLERTGSLEAEAFDAIERKWQSLGAVTGPLGRARSAARPHPDGRSASRRFERGSIVVSIDDGRVGAEAFAIWGAIHTLWEALGAGTDAPGRPRTDETGTPDGRGRFNHFDDGSIYWTPTTGAVHVPSAVQALWKSHGWERGFLGYPVPERWGRNLSSVRLQDVRSVHLFEGGVILRRAGDLSSLIDHRDLDRAGLDASTWRKRGEVSTDETWLIGGQGIAYREGNGGTDRSWFVTRHSGGGVTDVDRITELDKHMKKGSEKNRLDMRSAFGTDHAGDCDIWEDRIYVACESPHKVAVLDRSLRKQGFHEPRGRIATESKPHHNLPWCAVNPTDGLLYASGFDGVDEVYGYDMHRDWVWTKTIRLGATIERVQGGAFSPNGILFLASDDNGDPDAARIHAFNSHTGTHLTALHVQRDRRPSDAWGWFGDAVNVFRGLEEMEGIAFAPGVPYGDRPCALHGLVIRATPPRRCWVKHWEIPESQLSLI